MGPHATWDPTPHGTHATWDPTPHGTPPHMDMDMGPHTTWDPAPHGTPPHMGPHSTPQSTRIHARHSHTAGTGCTRGWWALGRSRRALLLYVRMRRVTSHGSHRITCSRTRARHSQCMACSPSGAHTAHAMACHAPLRSLTPCVHCEGICLQHTRLCTLLSLTARYDGAAAHCERQEPGRCCVIA
jgi:hypothetical protein